MCLQRILSSNGGSISTSNTELLLRSNGRTGKTSLKKNPSVGGGYLELAEQQWDCGEGTLQSLTNRKSTTKQLWKEWTKANVRWVLKGGYGDTWSLRITYMGWGNANSFPKMMWIFSGCLHRMTLLLYTLILYMLVRCMWPCVSEWVQMCVCFKECFPLPILFCRHALGTM